MKTESIVEEINHRIKREIKYYHGELPNNVALVWRGYIAAMLEWNLIKPKDHDILRNMFPPIEKNPVISIMTGIPGDHLTRG